MDIQSIRSQVTSFLNTSENPVPKDIAVNMVLQFLRDRLMSAGEPYLADGVPVLLLPDGTLKNMTLENQEISDFLHAAGLPLSSTWKRQLGDTLMSGNLRAVKLHGISTYDENQHVLCLNEWGGSFLRIDKDGRVSRHKNGDLGLLFAVQGHPHVTNLQNVSCNRALAWTDDDPLIQYVLGVGVFSETTGLRRHHALNVLLAWLLSVLLKDRVKTIPIPFLNGPSGARKTAIAQAVGMVITPEGMDFRVVACPNNSKDTENVIVNAHGIVALDEFQKAKELSSLLKAITTGAEIKRRILFTTAKEQTFHVDAVPFLTVNDDVWADDATQKRLLRIAMGQPAIEAGGNGWRGDFFIRRDWIEGRVRECAWTELVSRLAAAMRLLSRAKDAGRDDIRVNHRMSGFWSFVLAIAEQEGAAILEGMKASMAAVDETQSSATEWSDDLLELLTELLEGQPDMTGRWLAATEVRDKLNMHVNAMGGSVGLRNVVQSGFALHRRLCSSDAYRKRLGFQVRERHNRREYWFTAAGS